MRREKEREGRKEGGRRNTTGKIGNP